MSKTENEERRVDKGSAQVAMSYFIHQDTIYNNRFNFFIAIQAILLLAARDILESNSDQAASSAESVASQGEAFLSVVLMVGVFSSLIWTYIQIKQHIIVAHARNILDGFYPELYDLIQSNPKRGLLVVSNFILLDLVPVIFVMLWLFLCTL